MRTPPGDCPLRGDSAHPTLASEGSGPRSDVQRWSLERQGRSRPAVSLRSFALVSASPSSPATSSPATSTRRHTARAILSLIVLLLAPVSWVWTIDQPFLRSSG